jgi:nucleoside-diphosphate-sugar epimerase
MTPDSGLLLERLLVTLQERWFGPTSTSCHVPDLSGETILVTGAAGSLGSIMVESLLAWGAQVMALDHDEQGLLRLLKRFPDIDPVLDDLRAPVMLSSRLASCQRVIHAAAYKDVPFGESQPLGLWHNNVRATAHLLRMCREAGVRHFLLLSSDKSVFPRNMLGLSKWAAERLVGCGASAGGSLRCSVLRLCNVLGSRGSVLDHWRSSQIIVGTVPESRRWYMHPSVLPEMLAQWVLSPGDGIFLPSRVVEKSLLEVAQVASEVLAVPVEWSGQARPGDQHEEYLRWPWESPETSELRMSWNEQDVDLKALLSNEAGPDRWKEILENWVMQHER